MSARRSVSVSLVAFTLAAWLGGCATTGPNTAVIRASEYQRAFDAARESLVDAGFELERVDARAGVISTQPRASAGLAAPWRQPGIGFAAQWEDTVNRHQRRVRVTFTPISDDFDARGQPRADREVDAADAASTPPALPPDPRADRRQLRQDLVMRVDAVLERVYRPGDRVDPTSMRLRSVVEDTELRERRMYPSFATAASRDDTLSAYLLRDVLARVESDDGS